MYLTLHPSPLLSPTPPLFLLSTPLIVCVWSHFNHLSPLQLDSISILIIEQLHFSFSSKCVVNTWFNFLSKMKIQWKVQLKNESSFIYISEVTLRVKTGQLTVAVCWNSHQAVITSDFKHSEHTDQVICICHTIIISCHVYEWDTVCRSLILFSLVTFDYNILVNHLLSLRPRLS